MRRSDDGDATRGRRAQHRDETLGVRLILLRRRLVDDRDRRCHHEHAPETDSLTLAAGENPDRPVA